MSKKWDTKTVASAAIMAALVYVMTSISVRMPPPLGFWHIGDVASFIAGILFGPLVGTLACGVGATLFDVWSPLWGSSGIVWAPATLVIRGSMGYILGRFRDIYPKNRLVSDLSIMVIAAVWKNIGYFLYDYYLYGAAAYLDLSTFFLLSVVDIAITLPLIRALRKGFGKEKLL